MAHTADTQDRTTHKTGGAVALLVACIGHVMGVMTCAALMLAMGLPEHTFELAAEALRDGFVVGQLKLDGLTLLGLSGLIWGVLYGGASQMLRHDRRGRPVKVQRVARLSRGSVMTETLIVIPVYILVMLGTMQLSQNMMAGLLTTLAAFESGRTAAVWIPESETGRNSVDDALVRDKVRIAAATVVAPVAPAGFAAGCAEATSSDSLKKLVTGLKSAGHRDTAMSILSVSQGYDQNLKVGRGFDILPAFFRGIPKLTAAYCSTSIEGMELTEEDGVRMVTTTVAYKHMATMPIVAKIFGDRETVGDRKGYFSTITRAYKMPVQIAPNPTSPLK